MSNDDPTDRANKKAAVINGWLLGAATSRNPLTGALFGALPFLFPKQANKLADKFSKRFDAIGAKLYGPLEPEPPPAARPSAAEEFQDLRRSLQRLKKLLLG